MLCLPLNSLNTLTGSPEVPRISPPLSCMKDWCYFRQLAFELDLTLALSPYSEKKNRLVRIWSVSFFLNQKESVYFGVNLADTQLIPRSLRRSPSCSPVRRRERNESAMNQSDMEVKRCNLLQKMDALVFMVVNVAWRKFF